METTIKTIMIVALVIVIAAGIFAFIYFKYEKPAENNSQVIYNLNVKLLSGGRQVSEPFVIVMNGQIYKMINSSSETYTSTELPANSSFTLYTNSQHYYNTKEDFNTFGIERDIRKDIELKPYGNVTINITNTLIDKEIFVDITSNGTIKNPIICFRWSKNIVGVYTYNMSQINKPSRIENKVDKCFQIADEITDTKKIVILTFKWFGNIDQGDYIKSYLIDADVHYYGDLMAEDNNKNDIGIPDIYFEIK